jgi:branched-subunit amino acid transport protein
MIASNYFWLNIFFLSIGTIAIRFSFIAFSSKFKVTEQMKQIFSFIPSAILPALIAPSVFFHNGSVAILQGKERFVVLILSTIVCFFLRSTLATIVFGLVLLYLLNNYN